jgi:hypothetical protein
MKTGWMIIITLTASFLALQGCATTPSASQAVKNVRVSGDVTVESVNRN